MGHVEWIEFARVEGVPAAGEIVQAQEPGGCRGGRSGRGGSFRPEHVCPRSSLRSLTGGEHTLGRVGTAARPYYAVPMCIQCMMGAMTAVGTANGTRAWIGHRFAERIGPQAMRRVTVGLFVAAILAS